MGRLNFGGNQDLSGLFAGLIEQRERRIEQNVESAKNRALSEQQAKDAEVYAAWKAGKISDAEWLAHIRMRIADAFDPEEKSKYTELLYEHEGAIADAVAEANFAMGKLSVGGLLAHYRKRMGAVEKGSPAYRDMATRYGQLLGAAQSAGGGGGGGGGRRRSSGGSGASSASVISASTKMLAGGDTGTGFNTSGQDLIDPVNSMIPYEDDDDFIDGLRADLERIESIDKLLEDNPDMRNVVDPLTGESFEVTPEFLTEMDKQYLRTEQAVAAAYWARGESGDALKATQALGYATSWVAGAMQRHATMKYDPLVRQLEQHVFSVLVAASAIADPAERRREYAKALREVNRVQRNDLDEELAPELRPDAETFDRVKNLATLLDLGVNYANYTPEQINSIADELLSGASSIGEEGASVSIKALLDGTDGESDDLPSGFVGVLENMDQERGLAAGEALMAGHPIEGFDGPLYVYQYDGTTTSAVIADMRDVATPDGGVATQLVPKGDAAPEDLVMTRVKIGGKAKTVWVAPEPLDDPRFRVYRASGGFEVGNHKYDAGDLITSADLAELGGAQIRNLVQQGELSTDSVMQAVKLPDGRVWYRDSETGLFHMDSPFTVTDRDPTTGGIVVDDDGEIDVNYTPFAAGVLVPFAGVRGTDMEIWVRNAIAQGLINPAMYQRRGAAGEVEDLDSLEGMYVPPFAPGPRPVNPRMQDVLKARVRASEEAFMQAPLTARYEHHGTTPEAVEAQVAERTRQTAEQLGVIVSNDLTIGRGAAGTDVQGNAQQTAEKFNWLRSDFLADPRTDAQQAMESRHVVLGKKFAPPPVREVKPQEVAFAPPPVPRAPVPLMAAPAPRVPLPGEHLAAGKLPTSDTPSIIRTTDPKKGQKEIL